LFDNTKGRVKRRSYGTEYKVKRLKKSQNCLSSDQRNSTLRVPIETTEKEVLTIGIEAKVGEKELWIRRVNHE